MRLAIVGFGLIGGSIARALHVRAGPSWSVAAWSPGGTGPRTARAGGIVADAPALLGDAVADADLVVLAAPPLACLDLIAELGGSLAPRLARGAVVTDVASTKARIMAAAARAGLPFVGGHPMAGRDVSGYGAATDDLFVDRPWVVVAGEQPAREQADGEQADGEQADGERPVAVPLDAAERVERLARDVGARPVRLDATTHDEAVAAISHLPLILSAALVEAVVGPPGAVARADWAIARDLAASGWRDMTRLARGEPAMGAGIAATNGAAIAARLRDVRRAIDEWLDLLERTGEPDSTALEERFRADRSRLDRPS